MVADSNGSGTASAIEKTWGVVKYIGGGGNASLDLFPAVYFWGETGIHRPSGFLAMTSLVQDMLLGDELRKFTIHRARFEEFLIDKNGYVGRVLKKHGGWKKSLGPTKKMLRMLLDSLYEGKTEQEIEASLIGLLETKKNNSEEGDATFSSTNTWRETKASMRIKAALETAARCPICKARMVLPNSSDDHKTRRADGGSSYPDNGDLVHPYCNTGFKNYYDQRAEPLPVIEFP